MNRNPEQTPLGEMREHTFCQTVHIRVASVTQNSQLSEYTKIHTYEVPLFPTLPN